MAMIGVVFLVIVAATVLGQEKPIRIRLGPELEIGRKELLFGSIASVCEDAEANFYVLDRLEQKVFKFSPEGRPLMGFGQKGQGPGDFQSPGQIVLAPQGELAVLEDLYYVYFFKPDGTFIRRLDLNGRLGLGLIGPDRFYAWDWRPEDRQQLIVDAKNNPIKTFHSIARDLFSVTLPDETGRAVMFNYSNDIYVPQFLYAHGGLFSAIGISDRYEIVLLDEGGRQVTTIRRDLKPQKFSSREKAHLKRELLEFTESKGWPARVARELGKKIPSAKNIIRAVRISPEYVFIFRFPEDITEGNGLLPVDVFTAKGVFTGTANLAEIPLLVTDKTMYLVKTDELNNIYLVRMKYALDF
jgi:hypothetical protein